MDRIAHLALRTPDVVKTATFYKEVFGLHEEVRNYEPGAGHNPPDELARQIYLFDGAVSLAINKVTGSKGAGMDHFGFVVDNIGQIRRRLAAAGAPLISSAASPDNNHEFKYKGPEGVTIDVSTRGWPRQSSEGVRGKLQHIALGAPNVAKTANFYREVFGLDETQRNYERSAGDNPPDEMLRRVFLSDGLVNLTICKVPVVGMYHFGFLVDNTDETRNRLAANGATLMGSSPWHPGKHHEFKYRGPQDVTIDITTRGWGP